MPRQRFSGIQKAAIFFHSIEEDAVVEIFRHMEHKEVEQITNYMTPGKGGGRRCPGSPG